MFAFVSGPRPALLAGVIAGILLSGCSSAKYTQYTAENTAVAAPQTVAARADMEADGLPAQTPPVRRAGQVPDDPNEPYSRSYGGNNPSMKPLAKPEPEKQAPVRVPVPQQVTDNKLTRKYWKAVAVVRETE